MVRQYTATGATVEEAIENACRELGVSPLDVTPEILQLPKKGFFKKTPAEVRISIESEDDFLREIKKEAPVPQKPCPPAASAVRTEPVKAEPSKEAAVKPAEVKKAEPVVKAEEKRVLPVMKQASEPKKDFPEQTKAVQEKPVSEVLPHAPVEMREKPETPVSEEELRPKLELARVYLQDIFDKMGLTDIQIHFERTENRTVLVHIDGGDIGTVIGKRGETLDAIQYLVSLVANRAEGEYIRFTINAGNYREKREETLRALATRMAKRAIKTGRPVALEPMNPYERRIIHAVVTDIEGVYSKSNGEEPNRKVVIKPAGKSSQSFARRDSGHPQRGSRPPRANSLAELNPDEALVGKDTPVQEEKREPMEKKQEKAVETKPLDDVKLYSKIEL